LALPLPGDLRPQIRLGCAFDRLAEIPDDSIDCIVTSPPYWALRDYGVAGQLGLEPTLAEHIDTAVRYCRELRRVLKPTGTFWLNYGDSYASGVNGRSAADTKAAGGDDRTFRDKPFSTVGPIGSDAAGGRLKAKDLCMVPNRLAIALQDDGWWVRSEIIWAKRNPMPESAKDRPSGAHEKIFLLTKNARYFYDHAAVRIGSVPDTTEPVRLPPLAHLKNPRGLDPAHERGGHNHTGIDRIGRGSRGLRNWEPIPAQERVGPSVWDIATRAFRAAHFATFPPELAARCILAGCPEGGLVLDPFGGAGTTGLVAARLQRRSVLIELTADYADLARERIHADAPLLMIEPMAPPAAKAGAA